MPSRREGIKPESTPEHTQENQNTGFALPVHRRAGEDLSRDRTIHKNNTSSPGFKIKRLVAGVRYTPQTRRRKYIPPRARALQAGSAEALRHPPCQRTRERREALGPLRRTENTARAWQKKKKKITRTRERKTQE